MFRFRLERVLRHRQRQLDVCTRTVAVAEGACARAQETVAAATAELTGSRLQSAAARTGRLDPGGLARQVAWHEALAQRVATAEAAFAAARAEVAAARARLHQAWQDREVLQQLKERQRQAWALADARRERRQLDEIGANRAARDGGPGAARRAAASRESGRRSAESVEA